MPQKMLSSVYSTYLVIAGRAAVPDNDSSVSHRAVGVDRVWCVSDEERETGGSPAAPAALSEDTTSQTAAYVIQWNLHTLGMSFVSIVVPSWEVELYGQYTGRG